MTLVDMLLGVGDAGPRLDAWVSGHPAVALAIMVAAALLVTFGDAIQGAL